MPPRAIIPLAVFHIMFGRDSARVSIDQNLEGSDPGVLLFDRSVLEADDLDGAREHHARIYSVGEAAAHGRYANGEHDEACEGEGEQVRADICTGPIE